MHHVRTLQNGVPLGTLEGYLLQSMSEKLPWVAVKELKLSYYIGETLLFTMYTHYGNLIVTAISPGNFQALKPEILEIWETVVVVRRKTHAHVHIDIFHVE